ncbi:unnamed protein product, partial [marine sediment metagenome]
MGFQERTTAIWKRLGDLEAAVDALEAKSRLGFLGGGSDGVLLTIEERPGG